MAELWPSQSRVQVRGEICVEDSDGHDTVRGLLSLAHCGRTTRGQCRHAASTTRDWCCVFTYLSLFSPLSLPLSSVSSLCLPLSPIIVLSLPSRLTFISSPTPYSLPGQMSPLSHYLHSSQVAHYHESPSLVSRYTPHTTHHTPHTTHHTPHTTHHTPHTTHHTPHTTHHTPHTTHHTPHTTHHTPHTTHHTPHTTHHTPHTSLYQHVHRTRRAWFTRLYNYNRHAIYVNSYFVSMVV